MCESCWDADKKTENLFKNKPCDGNLKPFMTLNQLKSTLFLQWLETGKNHFRIYRKALFNPPETKLSVSAVKAGKDGMAEKQERITINFL